MSSISSVSGAVDYAQQYLELTNRVMAEGTISAETMTAQSNAETLVAMETALLAKTIEIDQVQSQQLIDLIA